MQPLGSQHSCVVEYSTELTFNLNMTFDEFNRFTRRILHALNSAIRLGAIVKCDVHLKPGLACDILQLYFVSNFIP